VSTTWVTSNYKADLTIALNELLEMESDRFELETRIAKQKKRIAALSELAHADDEGPAPTDLVQGITDACRTVFRATEKPLLPIEVKNGVEALGLPPQQNLLASVHTVIRRLLAAREVEEVPPSSGSGPIAYRSTAFSRFKLAHDAKIVREKAQKTPGQQIADLKAIVNRHK
jgi:hypothetical protein